jgi:RNA polymerase sigma factor (sigma-70 family)
MISRDAFAEIQPDPATYASDAVPDLHLVEATQVRVPVQQAGEAAVATTVAIEQITEQPKEPRPPRAEIPQRKRGEARRREDPDEDIMRQYMQEMGRYSLLTKDDEIELSKKREAGQEAARRLETEKDLLKPSQRRQLRQAVKEGEAATKTFIESNLRLVVSIARRYQANGMPLLDLIQEGNLGLMHAVEKFDYKKGFKFSTYSTWWIKQAITRSIADKSRLIRIPVHRNDDFSNYRKALRNLAEMGTLNPSYAELAGQMGVSEQQVAQIILDNYRMDSVTSLHQPLNEDGETELHDIITDPKSSAGYEVTDARLTADVLLDEIDNVLEEREKRIIISRYGLQDGAPKTLEQVGNEFGLTRERIRQIERKALEKLRFKLPEDIKSLIEG